MNILFFLSSAILVQLIGVSLSGAAQMTKYYVPNETDKTFKSKETVDIQTCKKASIAKVKKDFAVQIRDEGSGRLKDNTIVNLDCCDGAKNAKNFDCFAKGKFPVGSKDNRLSLFTSIAVKKGSPLKFGATVMVNELKNFKLPNGKTHNGCVKVDDDCGSCKSNDQIDLFVDKLQYYESKFPGTVTYKAQKCTVNKY